MASEILQEISRDEDERALFLSRKKYEMDMFSNFKAGSRADMTFNRNSIYEDWVWIIIRDNANDNWRVDSWGY